MEERRVINRVSENTVINSKNALRFFDGDLGVSNPEASVFHNGTKLEVGTHYEFIENKDPGSGERSLSLKIKIQLQPNDHFRVA